MVRLYTKGFSEKWVHLSGWISSVCIPVCLAAEGYNSIFQFFVRLLHVSVLP